MAVAAGAALVAALVAWSGRPGGSASSPARSVQLPGAAAATSGLAAIQASAAPSSGLGHARPPDPAALREAPARQAAYDAEARPGEFVTPPNVSIEH